MSQSDYVHGYSEREAERLSDQAGVLAGLLHHDTSYPPGSRVLEAGCGTGAQTVILAARSPQAAFVSIDRSEESIAAARAAVRRAGLGNVSFRAADIYRLPFPATSFDHVFVCFLLEHLPRPLEGLRRLKEMLRPGGTITVIEGDHASAFYHPAGPRAQRTIDCLVAVQAAMGGDSLIGRRVYPLLRQTGFADIHVTPRQVYADSSRPEWVEGFTRNTFIAMVAGAREEALRRGMIDIVEWERGIAELRESAGEDGTFSYTFFKGVAVKP
jgi:SAM-dependent methyltransferase